MIHVHAGLSLAARTAPTSDWNEQAEAAAHVSLAVAQIEVALSEADRSVRALSAAFVSMAEALEPIGTGRDAFPDGGSGCVYYGQAQAPGSSAIADDIQNAVMALQFHDRLTQKLSHVASHLGAVAELLGDPVRRKARSAWEALKQETRARHTMDSERSLADAVLSNGATSHTLMAPSGDTVMTAAGEGGTIDLF